MILDKLKTHQMQIIISKISTDSKGMFEFLENTKI